MILNELEYKQVYVYNVRFCVDGRGVLIRIGQKQGKFKSAYLPMQARLC